MLKEGKTKFGIISVIFISLFIAFAFAFSMNFVSATHTSNVSLEPEWSTLGAVNNYNVTFCKISGDTVNEVRIYKNWDGSLGYTNFSCEDKPGWEKLYIATYPACFYVADVASPNYNPLNQDNECETFHFSATAPVIEPTECLLGWKFETRDDNDYWTYLFDTTSIDSQPPVTNKTYEGLSFPDDINSGGLYPHYISTSTLINLTAKDMSETCGIGVNKTMYYVEQVDNSFCESEAGCHPVCDQPDDDCSVCNWQEYTQPFTIGEESCHIIQYYSVDKLGNMEMFNKISS